jgi:hypothetical protein
MKIASMGQESQEIEAYLSRWAACRGWIFQTERAASGGRYDVVLAGPMAGKAAPTCQTGILIAYDEDAGVLARQVQARTILTYGASKSTLSLSSAGESCVVALQRETPDLLGGAWEIGEFRLPGGLPGHLACAAVGALLACGWGEELQQ